MKAIGVTLGFCAFILMLSQSINLFITMETWNSADFLLISATMSFMSTAFMAIGKLFNK